MECSFLDEAGQPAKILPTLPRPFPQAQSPPPAQKTHLYLRPLPPRTHARTHACTHIYTRTHTGKEELGAVSSTAIGLLVLDGGKVAALERPSQSGWTPGPHVHPCRPLSSGLLLLFPTAPFCGSGTTSVRLGAAGAEIRGEPQ